MEWHRATIVRITSKTVLALCLFLAATAGTVAGASSTSTTPFDFVKNHQLYDRSEDIRSLQEFFNTNGFVIAQSGPGSLGNETSIFGLLTYRTLREFQSAHGLPSTGFFGPLTRAVVNSVDFASTSSMNASSPVSVAATSSTSTSTRPAAHSIATSTVPSFPPPLPGYAPGQIIFAGGGGDTIPPVVHLSGANPLAVVQNGTFSDPGATATDNLDGTDSVSVSGTVNTAVLGTYTLTYTATDKAGNTAFVTRTVNVTDQTPPAISAISSGTPGQANATTTWMTDEGSNSKVVYGLTSAYGSASSSASLVTSHSITVTGLTAATTYHYAVASADSSGNVATSSDQIFTTANTALPLTGNLVADFSADAITGVSNNAQFGSWTDSINGIVAAQATSTNQPVFTTNRVNGKPSVKFGGSAYLTIATPGALKTAIDSGDYTVFIVFKTLGAKGHGALFSATVGGDSFFYYADGTNVGRFTAFDPIPYPGQTSFSTFGSTAWNTTPTYSSSGKFQTVYVNGGAVSSLASAAPGTGGNTITIGSNAGNNFPINAEIFDILVWNTPLTPAQYKQAQMWADDKYGQAYPWAGINDYNVFFGDSIMQGVGSGAITAQAPYLIAQSLGLSYGQWDNIGVGGITTQHMSALAPTWVDPMPALLGKKLNLVGFEWYNENGLGGAGLPPVPFNDAQTYLAARKAVTNVRTVWGSSTGFNGDPSANRISYNNSLDAASTTNIDAYVALHNDLQIGTTTAYANHPSNWSDGVHLSATGYTFLASDFLTAIQSLPQ